MPLSSTERSRRRRERLKLEEEEKLSKRRERQRNQTREKRKNLRIMAKSPGDEPPPAPVETPLRLNLLSPIAELSPARLLAALERSRQRQNLTAQNAVAALRESNTIAENAVAALRESNTMIRDIADRDNAAEEQFQNRVLFGTALDDSGAEGLP